MAGCWGRARWEMCAHHNPVVLGAGPGFCSKARRQNRRKASCQLTVTEQFSKPPPRAKRVLRGEVSALEAQKKSIGYSPGTGSLGLEFLKYSLVVGMVLSAGTPGPSLASLAIPEFL